MHMKRCSKGKKDTIKATKKEPSQNGKGGGEEMKELSRRRGGMGE